MDSLQLPVRVQVSEGGFSMLAHMQQREYSGMKVKQVYAKLAPLDSKGKPMYSREFETQFKEYPLAWKKAACLTNWYDLNREWLKAMMTQGYVVLEVQVRVLERESTLSDIKFNVDELLEQLRLELD